MRTIIATIKREHLSNIRSGNKEYEMRKTCPVEIPFRVLCCQSKSGGQIIAEFEVHAPIRVRPVQWPELIRKTCVTMEGAEKYADGNMIWLWDISSMIDYVNNKGYSVRNVAEFGLKRPPQSWCYAREEGTV